MSAEWESQWKTLLQADPDLIELGAAQIMRIYDPDQPPSAPEGQGPFIYYPNREDCLYRRVGPEPEIIGFIFHINPAHKEQPIHVYLDDKLRCSENFHYFHFMDRFPLFPQDETLGCYFDTVYPISKNIRVVSNGEDLPVKLLSWKAYNPKLYLNHDMCLDLRRCKKGKNNYLQKIVVSDTPKCFNREWIQSRLPPGTYCNEPYMAHYELNDREKSIPSYLRRHRSFRVSDNHIGTVMVYPPADYEGGELVIYNDDDSVLDKISCHNEVTMVLLPISYVYEDLPITKGDKYVHYARWYHGKN
jgi:hypothetical protein